MTVTTKKWPPAVIFKSLVARASRAVLGFESRTCSICKKYDNVAKIIEVILHAPSALVGLTCDSKSVRCFSKMLISPLNLTQRKDTERKFNVPEV